MKLNVPTLGVISLIIALGASAYADTAESMLTRGKLQADLGNYGTASSFFEKVAQDDAAPAPVRWEALIRLARTRDLLGDRSGARTALNRLFEVYGNDDTARRYMLENLIGLQVSDAHWHPLASRFTFSVPADTTRPFQIDWSDSDPASCALTEGPGKQVSFDFLDALLTDVLGFFQVFGEVPITSDPCLDGMLVTMKLTNLPWDEALRTIVGAYGLTCRYTPGQGFFIGCGPLAPAPEMTRVQKDDGKATCPLPAQATLPDSLHFDKAPSIEVLRTIAAATSGWVQVDGCVESQATNTISLDLETVDRDGLEKLLGSLVRMNRLSCREEDGRLLVGCRGTAEPM